MILAWVISLLLLVSSLVLCLERLTALRIVEIKNQEKAQNHFIRAEQAVTDCENNIANLSALKENNCFIEPAGKNQWLISSQQKPTIQIHIHVDEKSGLVTRFNWRQAFE